MSVDPEDLRLTADAMLACDACHRYADEVQVAAAEIDQLCDAVMQLRLALARVRPLVSPEGCRSWVDDALRRTGAES